MRIIVPVRQHFYIKSAPTDCHDNSVFIVSNEGIDPWIMYQLTITFLSSILPL